MLLTDPVGGMWPEIGAAEAQLAAVEPVVAPDVIDQQHARLAELALVRAGLLDWPPRIDPKYLYDAQGCALHDAVCLLDEYYPARRESQILEAHRADICAALEGPLQWIDLGCADGAKSRRLLPHLEVMRYIGVDRSQSRLEQSVMATQGRFPELACISVLADFTRSFDIAPMLGDDGAPVFLYSGAALGNLDARHAARFLADISRHLGDSGSLLLGMDLVKDVQSVDHAYADALGVTAAFNRNALRVMNRLVNADFRPEQFTHRAHYDVAESRVEMQLVSLVDQDVHFDGGALRFSRGDVIITEHSYKYTPEQIGTLLAGAGLHTHQFWTDASGAYGVYLARC